MKTKDKRTRHLDARVNLHEHRAVLRRVPPGVTLGDWLRALALDQPLQRTQAPRSAPRRCLVSYSERLRQEALLSLATSLGRLVEQGPGPAVSDKLEVVLGLVREEILIGGRHADPDF